MSENNVHTSQNIFESIKQVDTNGNEFWLARELMPLLEYDKWQNFDSVVSKAKISLEGSYPHSEYHFTEISKKIKVGTGTSKEATRKIKDYKLSRRACYLIAQNGDSSKSAIALAQNYFTDQTRRQELLEEKTKSVERILARRKLSESEKKFAGVMNDRGVSGRGIAEIKSAGDQALFGSPTSEVKQKLGVKQTKPLADHLPTISIKAKDLATEMTTYKTEQRNLQTTQGIKSEHINNNTAVRKMLTESGIYPERLAAEEDVKKLEKKYSEQEILELADTHILSTDILEIDIRGVMDEDELMRIKQIIASYPGDSMLKIYYGSSVDTRIMQRQITINAEIANELRTYLVITD